MINLIARYRLKKLSHLYNRLEMYIDELLLYTLTVPMKNSQIILLFKELLSVITQVEPILCRSTTTNPSVLSKHGISDYSITNLKTILSILIKRYGDLEPVDAKTIAAVIDVRATIFHIKLVLYSMKRKGFI